MVSGSKTGSKEKKKMVFAKDKKQATLALVVLSLFLANSVYMVVKYFIDQIPPPAATTAQTQPINPANPETTGNTGQPGQPNQEIQPAAGNKMASPDGTLDTTAPTNPMTPAPPLGGINPIIPIILLLLVAGGVFGGKKFLDSQKFSEETNEHSANNSRLKQGAKENKKLLFAANKKQAAIAIVVLGFLALNTIYMIGKYVYEQNQPVQAVSDEANSLAEQQQQNLQNMDNPMMQAENNPSTDPNNIAADANNIYQQATNLQGGVQPATPATNNGSDVDIMVKNSLKKSGKMTLITVADSGRSNPFLPAAENIVPSALPKLNLLAPPETMPVNSDAGKVMTTTISGILYDKYSPSAIINIEGSDYLVKRGDIINQYKVLSIGKTEVIVQLGRNIYKAGVGELLTLTDINFNTIANLNKKFGGNNVSINVKKKGY